MSNDDARVRLIRAGHTEVCDATCGDCNAPWPCDTAVVLAHLDALAAERDEWKAKAVDHAMTIDAKNLRIEQVKRLYDLTRAERDALAARLAAAESARDAAEQIIADVQFDLINCHQQNACAHIQDALMIVNRHGAALAGNREQAQGEGA